jgi:hypothetical protein
MNSKLYVSAHVAQEWQKTRETLLVSTRSETYVTKLHVCLTKFHEIILKHGNSKIAAPTVRQHEQARTHSY